MTIRGAPVAGALVATGANPAAFEPGRSLAARIGLVPRQNPSGGKERLGGVTKAGNRHLRQMTLTVGALAVVRRAARHGTRRPWPMEPLTRKPRKVAAIALANRIARAAWAPMTNGQSHREPRAGRPAAA